MSLPASLRLKFKDLSHQSDQDFDAPYAGLVLSKVLKPSARLDDYEGMLDQLARDVADVVATKDEPLAKIRAFCRFLADDFGLHGDDDAFDDLGHMNLFSVLETKCGTAMALSLIYLHCAASVGFIAEALNFPGHSLVRLSYGPERVIVDPFAGAVELDVQDLRQFLKVIGGADVELSPKFYQAISPKTLFMRHLNGAKAHFLRCVQMEQALEMLQVLNILEEKSATYWRETGLLQARIGQLEDAAQSLRNALRYTTDPETIRHTQHIIDDLETRDES